MNYIKHNCLPLWLRETAANIHTISLDMIHSVRLKSFALHDALYAFFHERFSDLSTDFGTQEILTNYVPTGYLQLINIVHVNLGPATMTQAMLLFSATSLPGLQELHVSWRLSGKNEIPPTSEAAKNFRQAVLSVSPGISMSIQELREEAAKCMIREYRPSAGTSSFQLLEEQRKLDDPMGSQDNRNTRDPSYGCDARFLSETIKGGDALRISSWITTASASMEENITYEYD